MKVKLKPGIGTIANAAFTLSQGQIVDINPASYDSSIMVMVDKVESKKEKLVEDINRDGVVDNKDISLAAKIMSRARKKKSSPKKKSKRK